MNDYLKFLDKSDLLSQMNIKQSEIRAHKVKPEPADAAQLQIHKEILKELELTVTSIQNQLKVLHENRNQIQTVDNNTQSDTMIKSMLEANKISNVTEAVRTVPKLQVGDEIEKFVAELDILHKVEVEPLATEYPVLETEFIRAAKRLLTPQMFSQLEKSQTNATTWALLKAYLVKTHGTKITVYQHLNKLWNYELGENERIVDFGARLDEQVHKACLHIQKIFKASNGNRDMTADDVFKLMGAMLTSIQLRNRHEGVFRSMIKEMDKHWTTTSLTSNAQDYIDRLGTQDVTKPSVFLAQSKTTKSSTQKKSPPKKSNEDDFAKVLKAIQNETKANAEAIKSLTLTNQSGKTGGSKNKLDELRNKLKDKVCVDFRDNGKCKYGTKCFKKHVRGHSSNHADTKQDVEDSNQFDALFANGSVQK